MNVAQSILLSMSGGREPCKGRICAVCGTVSAISSSSSSIVSDSAGVNAPLPQEVSDIDGALLSDITI